MSPASTITQEKALHALAIAETWVPADRRDSIVKVRSFILSHPDGQREPVAWAVFADNGNIRLWAKDSKQVREFAASIGKPLVPLYTRPLSSPVPQDSEDDNRGSDAASVVGD